MQTRVLELDESEVVPMMAVAIFLLAAAAVLLLDSGSRSSAMGGETVSNFLRDKQSGQADNCHGHGVPAPFSTPNPVGRNAGDGIEKVPLLLDLLGTALASGLTIQNALQVVAGVSGSGVRDALRRVAAALAMGVAWDEAWEGNTDRLELAQLHAALNFGALTGASAAGLLTAEAAQIRRAGARQAEKRAAALGVKLVVPLGLCSLPAFIALGIVPVVVAMVPAF